METPRPLHPRGSNPGTHGIRGWTDPRASLDAVTKRKIRNQVTFSLILKCRCYLLHALTIAENQCSWLVSWWCNTQRVTFALHKPCKQMWWFVYAKLIFKLLSRRVIRYGSRVKQNTVRAIVIPHVLRKNTTFCEKRKMSMGPRI